MSARSSRAAALLLLGVGFAPDAEALPMYALRSGRTCGNCHVSPTFNDPDGWDNPELAERKCNMSCIACHVSPTGGGLRNSSGRYYGQSTLSMLPTQERSYSDYGREMIDPGAIAAFRDAFWHDSAGPRAPGPTIPSSFSDVETMTYEPNGGLTLFGRPFGGPSKYALWDGRYGDLIADPMVQLGGDARAAYWSGSQTAFPMQVDLHAAMHPVEHFTVAATAALRGRTNGVEATVNQDEIPVFARTAYAMAHELPYAAWARAGVFMPSFGTYLDDHTSPIRQFFDMDVSKSEDTVLGVELGMAPNYPFATVSAFRGLTGPTTAANADPGWGGAVNLGYRDMGFTVTAHGMIKRRDLGAGGDVDAAGLGFGLNPFYYSNDVPLTYMGEVSFARRQRAGDGQTRWVFASYHELWGTIANGLVAKLKYDVGNRDVDGGAAFEHRVSLGLDVSPIPGVTLLAQGRLQLSRAATEPDVFVHLHLWF